MREIHRNIELHLPEPVLLIVSQSHKNVVSDDIIAISH